MTPPPFGHPLKRGKRKATTRGLVLWRCRRSRVWARDEGLGREGVVIVKEIPDQVRNDSKGWDSEVPAAREWRPIIKVTRGGLKCLRVVNVTGRRWPLYVLLHSRR